MALPSDRVRVTQPLIVVDISVMVSRLILGGIDVIVDVIECVATDVLEPLLVS